ncbi:hypothetical protein [uncultured Cellulomonas sp.]|uniref:hypothetical protein n=1 Tax=uncultured Cellulomonas sp. TaxID=189682 RepID=UPI0026032C63|nr:hypothetical protein [uncultured Cellulomonas sp.]
MNENLRDALHGFVATESRAAHATPPELDREIDRLTRRVARRRAARAGGAVTSAAAVTVVAVSLVLGSGAGRDPAPPAPAEPAPSSTSRPTQAPPVAPLPEPVATPAPQPTVAVVPSLASAQPMAPGLLATTDGDWRLVRHQVPATPGGDMSPAGVYLLAPDGAVYEVPVVGDPAAWYLLDWLPGTSLALVQQVADPVIEVIDLLTGATVHEVGAGWAQAQFVRDGSRDVLVAQRDGPSTVVTRRVGLDGALRATGPAVEVPYGTTAWVASPSTSDVVVNAVSGPRVVAAGDLSAVATLAPYPDRPAACRAWGWVSDAEVLLECATGGTADYAVGDPSEFWVAPVSGPARLLAGMPPATRVGGVWRVGARLVAGLSGPTESEASWWEVGPDGVTPLSSGGTPAVTVVDVRGSELVAVQRSPWGSDPSTATLVAVDPATGATRTLLATPDGDAPSVAVVPAAFGDPPQTHTGD